MIESRVTAPARATIPIIPVAAGVYVGQAAAGGAPVAKGLAVGKGMPTVRPGMLPCRALTVGVRNGGVVGLRRFAQAEAFTSGLQG